MQFRAGTPQPAAPPAGNGGGNSPPPAPPGAADGGDCGPAQPGLSPSDLTNLLGPSGPSQPNRQPNPANQSFTAGTRVLLASGKTAPISSLKPGDKVQARDTATGKNQPETVTAVEVHHDTNLYDLKIKTPHGVQVIHTTANHLFWDPYLHYWVPTNKLSNGEHLKAPNGATATAVGGTTPKVHDGWIWDLTVPGNNDHDFYVVAGTALVLVHNAGGPGSPTKGDIGTQKLIGELEANGYMIRGTEISATAANGVNVRFDVVAEKNGVISVYDAKNGPRAMFTKGQGQLGGYESIETSGGTWYGPNAEAAGLRGSFGATNVNIAGYGGYKFSGLCR